MSSRPRVSFDSGVPGVYRCEVRNAATNAVVQAKGPLCTSPFAPSADLPDGKYTYNVWAYHNNDESITPFTKTFTVDSVSPATALDVLTGPQEGSLLTIGTATFAFSSNEGGSFQCSLDGAPFTACASPVSYSGLAGGAHGFVVRALDSAGNVDSVGKSRSWTIFVPPAPIIITQGSTNPEQINATVAYGFNVKGSKTTLGGFNVKNVPFGSTVTVTCVAGTCPAVLYKKVKGKKVKQALVITKAFGTVSLKKLVSKPLKAGTVLEILVSKPGAIGAVKRLTIRKGKKPTLTSRCLPPGAKKSVAC